MTTIRKARPEDLSQLLDFEQQLIVHERPMDPSLIQDRKITYYDLSALFADEKTEIFVALNDGKTLGCGYGTVRENHPKFRESRYGYIGFIFVHQDFRGQGIADRILKTLIKNFNEKGVIEIRLNVYAQNYGAVKSYEKSGFSQHMIEMRFNSEEQSTI